MLYNIVYLIRLRYISEYEQRKLLIENVFDSKCLLFVRFYLLDDDINNNLQFEIFSISLQHAMQKLFASKTMSVITV